jgi:hypothetical protein
MSDPKGRYPHPLVPWVLNPDYDGSGVSISALVGDRFLIAVPLSKSSGGFDMSVIKATETGWDDSNSESWSAWDWNDVEWYVPLDGARKHMENDSDE